MKQEKKLLKNTMLLMVGNFSSKILVFLLVPFYTRVLSTDEYAISDLLMATVSLLYPLASMMISTAVLRFCLDKKNDSGSIISIGLRFELAGFLAVCIITKLAIQSGILYDYWFYFMGCYLSGSIYTVLMNYAKGIGKVGVYAFAGGCNTVMLVGCNLLFLLCFGMGIEGYTLAVIVAQSLTAAYVFIFCGAWKDIRLFRKLDRQLVKKMVRYSLPLIPNSLSWWINNSADRYIIRLFCSLSVLGTYAVAYKIPSVLSTLSGILISAWEISSADGFGSEENRRFFEKMYRYYFDILMICAALLIVFVKPLAMLLYQNEFYEAWRYVPALVFASVFSVMNGFLGTIFTGARKTKSIFTTTLMGALANIALNLVLIPRMGVQGAALATAVSYMVVFAFRVTGSQRIINIRIPYADHAAKIALLLGCSVAAVQESSIAYWLGAGILALEWRTIRTMLSSVESRFWIKQKGFK